MAQEQQQQQPKESSAIEVELDISEDTLRKAQSSLKEGESLDSLVEGLLQSHVENTTSL